MRINNFPRPPAALAIVAGFLALSAAVVLAGSRHEASPRVIVISEDGEETPGRGYLGVSVQQLNRRLREAMEIPSDVEGVLVTNVRDDTPADEAGLAERDVITRFNGRPVTGDDDFTDMVRDLAPEARVTLAVWREGRIRDVQVTLGRLPESRSRSWSWSSDDEDGEAPRPPRAPRAPHPPDPPSAPHAPRAFHFDMDHMPGLDRMVTIQAGGRMGVELQEMNEEIAGYFGAPDDRGALVWKVIDDSPAEAAGLKAGDVIVEVEGDRVDGTRELREILSGHEPGETVAVTFLRRGQSQTARVTLGEPESPNVLFYSDGTGDAPRVRMFREPGQRRQRGPGADDELDRSMERLNREMEELNRRMERLRDELSRLKD